MNTILLCRSLQVPTPEQVAEALRQAGYPASVDRESGSLITSLMAEIRYAPDRLPIKIQCYSEQRHNPQYQISYEEWRWTEDIVQGAMNKEDIRRFIFVEAQPDVEAGALQTVVDYIAGQTNAVIGSQ